MIFASLMGVMGGVSAQSGQTRSVSGFNSIANAGPFAVHVKLDGTESLKIVGDPSVVSEMETVVTGGNLEIRFRRDHREHNFSGRIDVYVTARSLSGLTVSSSGSLDVDGVVSASDVAVTLSGSGSITSAVQSSQLGATISGSGSIHLKGSATDTRVTISGSGKLSADALKAQKADVTISGSGDAYINVDKTISASIVGSGSVIYSGNATISDARIVGSGRVRKG